MKKTITSLLTSILTIGLGALTAQAQTGYPYFPASEVANDITTVASVVDNPATALVDLTGNFTIQVAGTAGNEIKISNGSIYYAYTPTATGEVRFVKKNGTVHVYEGISYKNTITSKVAFTYPEITNATVTTSSAQLLQNASFETTGTLVGGTNFNFGTPWVTNVTVAASGGIRIMTSASAVNGTYVCVWRGRGNANYFAQPLTNIKASTSYQILINQIAGANASAPFHVGFGSTPNGLEYGEVVVTLGNGLNGLKTLNITTPSTIAEGSTVYFTFKNDATGSGDPLTQMDYISLVEGTVAFPQGISGATGNVYYVANVYSPQVTVNYLAGDYYDMTSLIANPSFEISGLTSWTNNGMATQTNVPGQNWIKDGNVYAEKWVNQAGNLPVASITQTVSGLMNGAGYKLKASAHSIKQGATDPTATTGTYLYAGALQVLVNAGKEYTVGNIEVTDNTLAIGFKLEGEITSNWAGVDNFRLTYHSNVANVTFTPNGGSVVATQYVTNGEKTTEPAVPTKAGFNFGGWCTDAALTAVWDFNTVVTADVVLYAKWIEQSHIASLSDLKVGDNTIVGFDATTLTYDVVLTEGTTVVPTVTATTTDLKAKAVVTPASALPGKTDVEVTAEDGTTKLTYSINFTVAVPTGIGSSKGATINVYPTISKGVFNVDTNGKSCTVKVLEITGKVVAELSGADARTIHVDKAGIYLLKVECEGVTKLVKVVKTN